VLWNSAYLLATGSCILAHTPCCAFPHAAWWWRPSRSTGSGQRTHGMTNTGWWVVQQAALQCRIVLQQELGQAQCVQLLVLMLLRGSAAIHSKQQVLACSSWYMMRCKPAARMHEHACFRTCQTLAAPQWTLQLLISLACGTVLLMCPAASHCSSRGGRKAQNHPQDKAHPAAPRTHQQASCKHRADHRHRCAARH
jgi:hypothetical protein